MPTTSVHPPTVTWRAPTLPQTSAWTTAGAELWEAPAVVASTTIEAAADSQHLVRRHDPLRLCLPLLFGEVVSFTVIP
ncbi:hypothetical protein [Mycobacterium haemophilum]|uniref:hypothetical protein n=1 Tax=Mycobacterium haemophilum TaxID=29311 RepID=UPI0012E37D5D|nr:hypothetical protein [Mycobacterium haemophilum]MCV7340614.1 hypothetical protein [Mycobacterium haemophilum DSM 44634]